MFHGRVPYIVLIFKVGTHPQKIPTPSSQEAQDLLEKTEIIFQDVRKNAMQVYTKDLAFYDKKAKASNLKETDYVYVLEPNANHQRSKISFADFRWIGSYIVEKSQPNDNYLKRKIGTYKTQVFLRMRLSEFTSQLLTSVVQITEKIPQPKVIIKLHDVYARAWECEHKGAITDYGHDNAAIPHSSGFAVQFDLPNNETSTIPQIIRKSSPRVFSPTQIDHVTERIRIIIWSLMRIR